VLEVPVLDKNMMLYDGQSIQSKTHNPINNAHFTFSVALSQAFPRKVHGKYPLTRESGYNTYRGWAQIEYQHKHYNIDRNDEGTLDDRGRDGVTNFILRKEKETRLTLHEEEEEAEEEEDDEEDDDDDLSPKVYNIFPKKSVNICDFCSWTV
jgi:hypothetical protein